jgi:hypothetical protein
MSARQWFPSWLKEHQAINPHREFSNYEAPGFDVVYAGWIRAFDARGIDYDQAIDASERMQAQDKREIYPEHHLPRIIALAETSKAREQARETKQRAEKAESARLDAEQELIRKAWQSVKPETKEKYREKIRAKNNGLTRFTTMIEIMARNAWADEVRTRRRAKATNESATN